MHKKKSHATVVQSKTNRQLDICKCNANSREAFPKARRLPSQGRYAQPPPTSFYLSACQQDVTVPALSHSSRSSCPLPLPRAALPHCSLSFIFPTSLLSLPPFFPPSPYFPFFPFPPQHDITLALTHYQCRGALLSYAPHKTSSNTPTSPASVPVEFLC